MHESDITARNILMKNIQIGLIGVAVLMAAAITASGGSDDIHITSSQTVNDWWRINDAGYLWDIYTGGGHINTGTNNAYSGSMLLQVNNAQMGVQATAKINKEGDEIEIGPWTQGAINVYRRVYVDRKMSYARWIDIFENTSDSLQKLDVRVRYNMGSPTQQIYTTLGQAQITDKDWGLITLPDEKSGQPYVAHIFAGKNAKFRPSLQINIGSNTHWCISQLEIPAKKAVALCYFESQHNMYEDAKKFLGNFNPARETRKIPAALRGIILNMESNLLTLGSLELPRKENADFAVLDNGNEITGTIINDKFSLETPFGKVELPADRVIGFQSDPTSKEFVQAGLVDGQIVSGKLISGPIKIRLSEGYEIPLSPGKFATATFMVSDKRPAEIPQPDKAMIVLLRGQQFFFDTTEIEYVFQTEHGELKLSSDNLRTIYLTGHEGSMHMAELANGTMLSGLLTTEKIKLKLELGLTMEISRQSVARLIFPKGELKEQPPWNILLNNNNELFGTLATESLVINSDNTPVTIKTDDIASAEFDPEAMNIVTVKLFNGTAITGSVQTDKITVQLQPNLKLDIHTTHISVMTHMPPPPPQPETTTTLPDAATPAPDGTTPPHAASSLTDEEKAKINEELRRMEAELNALQQAAVSLADQQQKMISEGKKAAAAEVVAKLEKVKSQMAEVQKKFAELKAMLDS